ncbi:MAG: HAD-IA family hydrolase [Fimbriimonadaceae bacterium]|nr:HAD-IA family hydrolase [Fimbriimonadaceae bacterium]
MARWVCFDIGGVMVEIAQTWADALKTAALAPGRNDLPGMLPELDVMNRYQSGEATYPEYLAGMADALGITAEAADRVHRHILKREYPGIADLVADLRTQGISTSCLSNTNAPHWEDLTDPAKFPTVAGLSACHASHLFRLGKPDPAIYRAFEAAVGAEPGDIVFFDDNLRNVEVANECGWRAYRIDPFGDPPAAMRAHLRDIGWLG